MGRTNNYSNNSGSSKDSSKSVSRRRAGMAIDDFAHRKGVTKAIQKFRERKDKKRTDTAKALRQYKKTMKQEGFEPGRGASRKRTANNNFNNNDEESSSNKRPQKANPFSKSLQKAETHKQQVRQAAADKEANLREKDKKIKERRRRSKQMRQRTSKGQPVMKHAINDILRKLEREKKQEEEAAAAAAAATE